jgi:hypothetical protein
MSTGRLITFVLVTGVIVLSVVMFVISAQSPATDGVVMSAIGIAVAVSCWLASVIVPQGMKRFAKNEYEPLAGDLDRETAAIPIDQPLQGQQLKFAEAWATSTLVGQAMLEAGCVINLVLMLIGGQTRIHLAVTAILLIVLLMRVPTLAKWDAWTS